MKITTPFLLLLFWSFFGQAQEVEIEVEENFEADRAHVFQPLDLSEVTSGLLLDYGIPLLPPHRYDGSTLNDTTRMIDLLFGLTYATLHSAALDSTEQLPDPSIYMSVVDSYQPGDPIPIGILLQQYHYFRTDAIDENLIDTLGGQLFDVPNRPESPYLSDTVFAASALIAESDSISVSFVVPGQLIFNNHDSGIQSISVDLDDGVGWQAATPDVPVAANYGSAGTKTLVIKCILNDGSEWLSHCLFNISESADPSRYSAVPDTNHLIAPTSEHSGAILNVFLGCDGYVPGDPFVLRNPVLVIEGADPPQTGNRNWRVMLRFLDEEPDGNPSTVLDIFDDNHIDLIYLDFLDGTDDMIRNARCVQDAIDWINAQKPGPSEDHDNIVVGVSMGGPVGKWALREMENNGEDHQTKKFITFDAPMRGNNFPLGLQHMLKHLLNMRIGGVKVKSFSEKLRDYEDIFFQSGQQTVALLSCLCR